VRQAEVDEGKGSAGALTTAEREEFARLRKEVRQLTMKRDFLKKRRSSSRRRARREVRADGRAEGPLPREVHVPAFGCVTLGLLRLAGV